MRAIQSSTKVYFKGEKWPSNITNKSDGKKLKRFAIVVLKPGCVGIQLLMNDAKKIAGALIATNLTEECLELFFFSRTMIS